MIYYTHRRHTVAGQNVHVEVPLCHTGDLVPDGTQQIHTDGRQHTWVDVHSEDSIKKKINNIFCKNNQYKFSLKSVENIVTPHGKRKESISTF